MWYCSSWYLRPLLIISRLKISLKSCHFVYIYIYIYIYIYNSVPFIFECFPDQEDSQCHKKAFEAESCQMVHIGFLHILLISSDVGYFKIAWICHGGFCTKQQYFTVSNAGPPKPSTVAIPIFHVFLCTYIKPFNFNVSCYNIMSTCYIYYTNPNLKFCEFCFHCLFTSDSNGQTDLHGIQLNYALVWCRSVKYTSGRFHIWKALRSYLES